MPRRRKSFYDFGVTEQPAQLAASSPSSSSSPVAHSNMADAIEPVAGSASNSSNCSFVSGPVAASACSSSQFTASAVAGAIVPVAGSSLSSSNSSCASGPVQSVASAIVPVGIQSGEGGQIVSSAQGRQRQPWSHSRRQVQHAIVAARKRHCSALAARASSLPLVPRQGKQRGAWSCDHILHATFPVVRGISQTSAISVLAGIDERKTKKKHAMTVACALQDQQASAVAQHSTTVHQDQSILLGIGFDETLQWVAGGCLRGEEARGCLSHIRVLQSEKHRQWVGRRFHHHQRKEWADRISAQLTQSMVQTMSFKVLDADCKASVDEDLVVPPCFIARTTADNLFTALTIELERILGEPLDSWLANTSAGCRWLVITIHADRAKSNFKIFKFFAALTEDLPKVLIMWDPCCLHGVQNVSDNSLRLRNPVLPGAWPVKTALFSGSRLMRFRDFSEGMRMALHARSLVVSLQE